MVKVYIYNNKKFKVTLRKLRSTCLFYHPCRLNKPWTNFSDTFCHFRKFTDTCTNV